VCVGGGEGGEFILVCIQGGHTGTRNENNNHSSSRGDSNGNNDNNDSNNNNDSNTVLPTKQKPHNAHTTLNSHKLTERWGHSRTAGGPMLQYLDQFASGPTQRKRPKMAKIMNGRYANAAV
jgi:hypothetical protein